MTDSRAHPPRHSLVGGGSPHRNSPCAARRGPAARLGAQRSRAFKFGLGALVILGAAGALLHWRKHHAIAGGVVGGVGALLFLLALIAPAGALAVRGVWMRFAGVIGWINSRIILGVLFFLIVTPIALVRRLRGREAYRFEHAAPPKAGGYWRKRDKPYDPSHYEHPY